MDRDLLASLLQPSDGRAVRFVEEIVARCWPGGAGDRTQPAAREWLRRWAPKQLPLRPPVCSCPAGRCSACN